MPCLVNAMQHADLHKESQSSTPSIYHSTGNIPTLLSEKASEKEKTLYHFFSSTLSEDQTGGQVAGGGRVGGWGV